MRNALTGLRYQATLEERLLLFVCVWIKKRQAVAKMVISRTGAQRTFGYVSLGKHRNCHLQTGMATFGSDT
jgi:hypothetical protein